jgi:hypothetical protein
MGAVENLLIGAVDLHCHSGPSPMPRRITHTEAARQAASLAGLGAVIEHELGMYHNERRFKFTELLDSGVKEEDIQLMIRDNPARFIGLE